MPPDSAGVTAGGQSGDGAEPSSPLLFQEGEAAPAPPPRDPYAHLPEDLRAPWNWVDLLISFFFGIGCVFVAAWMIGIFAAVWGIVQPAEGSALGARQGVLQVVHTITTFALLILYLAALIRMRYQRPFWRTIGFRKFHVGKMDGAASAVVIFFTGMFLSIVVANVARFVRVEGPIPLEKMFETPLSAFAFLAAAVVVAPFVEETLFRGWLYPVIARTFGVAGAVLIVGGLFGLMHGAQLGGHWQLVALLSFVGMVLTWIRARTGSVLSSYFLHLGYNALIAFAFIAQTSGLRNLPGGQ